MAPKQRPCKYFQTSSCQKGSRCTFAHVVDPEFKRKACEHFAKGRCNRGDQCKFSHDPEDIHRLRNPSPSDGAGSSGGNHGSKTAAAQANTEARFAEWRYLIPAPNRIHSARPLGTRLCQFWKDALSFVSGEAGLMQETVALLASEGGCLRVKELTEQRFDKMMPAQMSRVFDTQLLPFLQTITHRNVLNSIILAPRLMTIYNILYGADGEPANALFGAITQHLQGLELVEKEDGTAIAASLEALEASLRVFEKLVEVNTHAQVHDGLKHIAETLSLIFEESLPGSAAYSIKPSLKHYRRIQQRLGLGQAIQPAGEQRRVASAQAVFNLLRERPGELSEDGKRHNNDSVDIRQISILPTLQEIQSSRTEYLPLADPKEWHLGGLEGLLDRNFRLLREDTVGQLRDAAKFELERLQSPNAVHNTKRQGVRTFVYSRVRVVDVAFDSFNGIEFALQFDQPQSLYACSKRERQDWWEGSKRLGHEALICLLGADGAVTFFVVSSKPLQDRMDRETGEPITTLHQQYNLWSEAAHATIIAKPVVSADCHTVIERLLLGAEAPHSLVEFPGVLLPAFGPTLRAMQKMSEALDMPFADILAPTATPQNPDGRFDVAPPAYATRPGFSFKLDSITSPGANLRLKPGDNIDEMTEKLANNSTLDEGQARAVVFSLLRSLAAIQGPPGTGKSYTLVQFIKILLDNKKAGDLGPIVCVCFTNHALDQGLERLLDEGVSQVVRIGGSSKSVRLADVNLREVTKRAELTKTEKHDRWDLTNQVERETREINRVLASMNNLYTDEALQGYLQHRNPGVFAQLFDEIDADGFTRVQRHGGKFVEGWLKDDHRSIGRPRDIEALQNVHAEHMTGDERRMLYQSWIEDMQAELQDKLRLAMDAYSSVKKRLDAVRTEQNLRALRQANIIGLTTSGLARNLDLLQRTGAKVLVCEEAGEVLEAHLLTALLPSVEHAILIGDHQQLRPHTQNYDLSCESRNGGQYSLDVSLFERLVSPQDRSMALPLCTLTVQRRMHKQLSKLIRRTLYPQLQDAASVQHPEVVGMRHRMYWMQHTVQEDGSGNGNEHMSHTNQHEVDMVAALVKHLVDQGAYSPQDVAVITPYLGQLRKIRQKLGSTVNIILNERDVEDLQKEGAEEEEPNASETVARRESVARGTLLKALRLATVDNFEGEEAKVVIVSLVRSNPQKKPGFLRTSNRINVLLSRAQHGMYILGDAGTMINVPMWKEIVDIFKEEDLFGKLLELCCPRHTDTPLAVSRPEDFVRISPEGGCDLVCSKHLACGHACTSKCHSDLLHDAVFCLKQCQKPKPGCDHVCPKPCGAVCDPHCLFTLKDINVELACGHHLQTMPCYQFQDHSKVLCQTPVEKNMPGCGHQVTVPCNVDITSYRCTATCGAILPCGHQCQHACYRCRTSDQIEHGKCNQLCGRNFTTCSHRCKATCHGEEPCPLCPSKCDVSCWHATCRKKCQEPCTPCAEEICQSRCPHSQCSLPCAAPCDWLPCNLRCTKKLSCGHQCPSVCGEQCPGVKFCQQCGTDEVKAIQADMLLFETYGEINLDEEPCIFTPCGHIFTLTSMDGIMDMSKHYETDFVTGKITGLKSSSEPFSSDELKSCPTCRASLRSISRYGRIVRRALLDESAKKLTAWAHKQYAELSQQLSAVQARLAVSLNTARPFRDDIELVGSINAQLKTIQRATAGRYQDALNLRSTIRKIADKLREEELPYQRVRDSVETLRRQRLERGDPCFVVPSSELQLRDRLKMLSLLTRCDLIIFSDLINVYDKPALGPVKAAITVTFEANRDECDDMTKKATATHSVRQEVESRVYWARFAAMQCGIHSALRNESAFTSTEALDALNEAALQRLSEAQQICERFEGMEVNPTSGLVNEVETVRKMLNERLSTSEMKSIYEAMGKEFRGTGHWYRCENGHLFTIGECGMPMQLARCHECGAGIGGQSHQPTEGVERAYDFERQFGMMRL